MDAHRLAIRRRQLFPGLTDIFPPNPFTSVSSSDTSSSTTSDSSSSTSSTESSSSVPSTSSTTSSSTSKKKSSTSILAPSSTSTPPPAPTLTQFVTSTAGDALPTNTSLPAAPEHTAFLDNKVLSGLVFTLAGIVGLVVILMTVTYAVRRKRKSRLIREAVSFDPVDFDSPEDKVRGSGSSSLRRGPSSKGDQGYGPSDIKYDYAAQAPNTPAPPSAYVLPSAYNTYAPPGQYDTYDHNASQHGHGMPPSAPHGGPWNGAQYNAYGGGGVNHGNGAPYDRTSGPDVDVRFAPTYTH